MTQLMAILFLLTCEIYITKYYVQVVSKLTTVISIQSMNRYQYMTLMGFARESM